MAALSNDHLRRLGINRRLDFATTTNEEQQQQNQKHHSYNVTPTKRKEEEQEEDEQAFSNTEETTNNLRSWRPKPVVVDGDVAVYTEFEEEELPEEGQMFISNNYRRKTKMNHHILLKEEEIVEGLEEDEGEEEEEEEELDWEKSQQKWQIEEINEEEEEEEQPQQKEAPVPLSKRMSMRVLPPDFETEHATPENVRLSQRFLELNEQFIRAGYILPASPPSPSSSSPSSTSSTSPQKEENRDKDTGKEKEDRNVEEDKKKKKKKSSEKGLVRHLSARSVFASLKSGTNKRRSLERKGSFSSKVKKEPTDEPAVTRTTATSSLIITSSHRKHLSKSTTNSPVGSPVSFSPLLQRKEEKEKEKEKEELREEKEKEKEKEETEDELNKYRRFRITRKKKKADESMGSIIISAPTNARHKAHVDFDFEWKAMDGPREAASEFRLVSKLGQGGFGKVYKARHKDTGFILAIKCVPLPMPTSNDEEDHREAWEEAQKLQKEINALKRCRNRHIVSYYGCCFRSCSLWIMMECCSHGSVLDVMKRAGVYTLTERDIAYIFRDVITALIYLHEIQIIHRDLKPGNILVTAQARMKLADFGTANQLQNIEANNEAFNSFVGTPLYMSPEVLAGDAYDFKADIWSLGITAIHLAQGRPPNSNEHVGRAIVNILCAEPPQIDGRTGKWSAEFIDFVNSCLKKDTNERPSAKDLLLHPFITKLPASYKLNVLGKKSKTFVDDSKLNNEEASTEELTYHDNPLLKRSRSSLKQHILQQRDIIQQVGGEQYLLQLEQEEMEQQRQQRLQQLQQKERERVEAASSQTIFASKEGADEGKKKSLRRYDSEPSLLKRLKQQLSSSASSSNVQKEEKDEKEPKKRNSLKKIGRVLSTPNLPQQASPSIINNSEKKAKGSRLRNSYKKQEEEEDSEEKKDNQEKEDKEEREGEEGEDSKKKEKGFLRRAMSERSLARKHPSKKNVIKRQRSSDKQISFTPRPSASSNNNNDDIVLPNKRHHKKRPFSSPDLHQKRVSNKEKAEQEEKEAKEKEEEEEEEEYEPSKNGIQRTTRKSALEGEEELKLLKEQLEKTFRLLEEERERCKVETRKKNKWKRLALNYRKELILLQQSENAVLPINDDSDLSDESDEDEKWNVPYK
ncbi:Serine/threonine-protein kinase svkA [Balamuthia mandrillaris]